MIVHSATMRSVLRGCLLATALAISPTGCQDKSGPVDPPSVTIEDILLEGVQQNTVRALGTATAEAGLDSVRLYVPRTQYRMSAALSGTDDVVDVAATDIPAGSGILRIEVFDRNGNTSSDESPYEVPVGAATVEGTVMIFRDGAVVPFAGVEFCIERVFCDTVGINGSIRIDGLPLQSSYAIQIPEGANQTAMVSPSTSRSDDNVMQFTPADVAKGSKPTDKSIVAGVNPRTYVFFDDSVKPLEWYAEQYTKLGPTESERFMWDSDPDSTYGVNWNHHKFNAPNDTIALVLATHTSDFSAISRDSVYAAAARGVEIANECFKMIWDEPHTYAVKNTILSGSEQPYHEPGHIILWLTDRPSYFYVDVDGKDPFKSMDIVARVITWTQHPDGPLKVKRDITSGIAAALMGWGRLPYDTPDNEGYLVIASTPQGLLRKVNKIDTQGCFFTAFDHNSKFPPLNVLSSHMSPH